MRVKTSVKNGNSANTAKVNLNPPTEKRRAPTGGPKMYPNPVNTSTAATAKVALYVESMRSDNIPTLILADATPCKQRATKNEGTDDANPKEKVDTVRRNKPTFIMPFLPNLEESAPQTGLKNMFTKGNNANIIPVKVGEAPQLSFAYSGKKGAREDIKKFSKKEIVHVIMKIVFEFLPSLTE
mmetsp:Transcript_12957/g.17054  ORF Transcript_12957/g.17054 Transcript_12957/m.17054 type:complete len:183 (-) Transcript_12957:121-669(-)